MPTYSKPALTIKTQLQLLRRRGMMIADEPFAIAVLESCNFYRFGGYAIAFWLTPHRPQQYQPGTTFEDVVNIINFDRALRMLTMDAIERLEVAVRSIITSKASIFYRSPHWYLEGSRFKSFAKHSKFIAKCAGDFDRSKEVFALHYKKTYTAPDVPPSWVIAEITSFGTWSHLFENMAARQLRNRIAASFQINHVTLEKNLHVLNVTRNLCAHHVRIWNRGFAFTPPLRQSPTVLIPALSGQRFAAQAGMIWVMLRAVEPQSDWTRALRDLIVRYGMNATTMGFPANWDSDPFWGI
jgi:abortive infection bacteriophage resistance protein